ncbi:MAG: L,D-transpeptidase family protein [Bdellovibrionales bacterium]
MIFVRVIFAFLLVVGLLVVGGYHAAQAAYDRPYIGETIEYKAHDEDTFVHLARDYNLGFVEMRAANPTVDPWLPGEGTKVILPTRHILPDVKQDGIVINLPEMRLYVFNGDAVPTTFPIGVGREGLTTPTGTTRIVRKQEGPTWRPTPRMLREDPSLKPAYPPGPDNPMGTHAMYLGWPQYAIHGTNKPFGIGRRVSSGCIRMYPENIKQLFDMISVGTKVTVVNQPIKLAWIDDRLYLEAHPELEQAIHMEEYGQVESPKLSEEDLKRITKAAGAFEDKLRWPAIRMAVKERKGYPVEIARRPGSYDDANANANAAKPDGFAPDADELKRPDKKVDPKIDAIKRALTEQDHGDVPQLANSEVKDLPVSDNQDQSPAAAPHKIRYNP